MTQPPPRLPAQGPRLRSRNGSPASRAGAFGARPPAEAGHAGGLAARAGGAGGAPGRGPVGAPVKRFSPPRTALGFMLAPGIATVVFAVAYAVATSGDVDVDMSSDDFGTVTGAALAGVVAYLLTGLLAVPAYAGASDDARGDAAGVVLSAGGLAALSLGLLALCPRILFAALFAGFAVIPAALALAFAFGAVAGVAFVLIRGAPATPPR